MLFLPCLWVLLSCNYKFMMNNVEIHSSEMSYCCDLILTIFMLRCIVQRGTTLVVLYWQCCGFRDEPLMIFALVLSVAFHASINSSLQKRCFDEDNQDYEDMIKCKVWRKLLKWLCYWWSNNMVNMVSHGSYNLKCSNNLKPIHDIPHISSHCILYLEIFCIFFNSEKPFLSQAIDCLHSNL